jgi:FkbM family methyltransferase
MLKAPPDLLDNLSRAEMTARCRDCVTIPKVPDAGSVISIGNDRIQIMHNGVRVVADGYYGTWMTSLIERLQGHHEPQEELVFHEVLKHLGSQATMIELGGFWSYYSLWFLKDRPQGRSFVVEPDPNHIAVGKANACINDADIQFVHGCIGSVSRPLVTFATESAGKIGISQFSVADLLRINNIVTLDLLHCDTQGAETAVIESCEALLRKRRIVFAMFSTHAYQISGDPLTHQRCLQMLCDFGGTILAEHDVHESFSGDGLIAAYFGGEPIEWSEPPISRNRYSTSLFRNPIYDLVLPVGARR